MRAIATGVSALVLAGCAAGTTTGFAVEHPAGWTDRTDRAEAKAGRAEFELVLEGEEVDEHVATIVIARTTLRDGDNLERVVRVQRKQLTEADPSPERELTLDGEPALAFDFAARGERGRSVASVRGEVVYAVNLVSDDSAFEENARALDALLASWRWE